MATNSMKPVHQFIDNAVNAAEALGKTTLEEARALAARSFHVRLLKDATPGMGPEGERPLLNGMEFIARPDSSLTLGQIKGEYTAKLYKDGVFYSLLHCSYFEVLEELA